MILEEIHLLFVAFALRERCIFGSKLIGGVSSVIGDRHGWHRDTDTDFLSLPCH